MSYYQKLAEKIHHERRLSPLFPTAAREFGKRELTIRGGSTMSFLNLGQSFIELAGGIQAFAELGRATASGGETSLSVTSLANKKWLIVLVYGLKQTSTMNLGLRINNDSGSNYAGRVSQNGGADGTGTSQNVINLEQGANSNPTFSVWFIENVSSFNEKLIQGWETNSVSGAGNAPERNENVEKWANTSNPISEIDLIRISGTGTFANGSEIVVLGADPLDTNVTPFFVEQGRITDTTSVGTIALTSLAAKKYMYCTASLVSSASAADEKIRFNGVSTTTYSDRWSADGSGDSTDTSATGIAVGSDSSTTPKFFNFFCINISAQEKLVIGWYVAQNTAGAANAPHRFEFVGKHANTASQITEVDIFSTGGNFTSYELISHGSN